MDQKELLIIVRAVLSSLQGQRIKDSYPILYLEAASIRIHFHRGCLFGVCTYQPMSIPLLASLMDRITAAADASFRTTNDLDISNPQTRAVFLLAIRALISESPWATITREVRQSLNTRLDMAMNIGSSYLVDPVASGDFTTVAEPVPTSADDGSAHESTTETSTPIDTYTSEPSGVSEKVNSQFLTVRIEQEIYFEVRDQVVENVRCSVDLWMSVSGDLSNPVQFTVMSKAVVENAKLNPNVLESVGENAYRVIEASLLTGETKVLVFDIEHVENEPPPFGVHCAFAAADQHAEFKIAVGGEFPMADVLVGIDASGLEDPVCQDEPVVIAGMTACLRTDFIEAGGQNIWVMRAGIEDGYEPPKVVRVRCRLRGPVFGRLLVHPEPHAGTGIERVVHDMEVQQSVWPFTQ
jgi:hypothetical protein